MIFTIEIPDAQAQLLGDAYVAQYGLNSGETKAQLVRRKIIETAREVYQKYRYSQLQESSITQAKTEADGLTIT